MNANVDVVLGVYQALSQRDVAGAIARMSEDVEISLPGPSEIPFAGQWVGHDGAAQFFTAIGSNVDLAAMEIPEVIADAHLVVVLGSERATARPTGKSWHTTFAMAWTVQDGKVSQLREYHETAAIAAAFQPAGGVSVTRS
jgi:hypothetical protein